MSLEEIIAGLLHEKIGFNPESVGSEKILASIRTSLRGRNITDPERFIEELRSGSKEFDQIVNEVVIPETWFFRDGEPFELLKKFAATEWLPKAGRDVLRCLSIPTSTGEEPYSISMALLDSGLAPHQFQVDGIDISSKSIERAKRAVYGTYSFRGKNISFRDRYFEKTDESSFQLHDLVRNTVQFSQGNLLDPQFLIGRHYDIIFCRNLLIYFDPPGWNVALKALNRLLKDSGLLFMGHAEALEFTAPEFESVRFPCAFAYRKRLVQPAAPKKTTRSAPTTIPVTRQAAVKTVAQQPRIERAPAAKEEVDSQKPSLEKAGAWADQGKLAEAAGECERFLAQNRTSAQGHFLLGLIRKAGGNEREAEHFYRRALYLDSKHLDTMIHLALLLEGRGDKAGAATLRQRAARANKAE